MHQPCTRHGPRTFSGLNLQAEKHASSFRALVLIGVAAAFCAAYTPQNTKSCAASKLAEVDHPVVCPPQWLPVLLASICDVNLPEGQQVEC